MLHIHVGQGSSLGRPCAQSKTYPKLKIQPQLLTGCEKCLQCYPVPDGLYEMTPYLKPKINVADQTTTPFSEIWVILLWAPAGKPTFCRRVHFCLCWLRALTQLFSEPIVSKWNPAHVHFAQDCTRITSITNIYRKQHKYINTMQDWK